MLIVREVASKRTPYEMISYARRCLSHVMSHRVLVSLREYRPHDIARVQGLVENEEVGCGVHVESMSLVGSLLSFRKCWALTKAVLQ